MTGITSAFYTIHSRECLFLVITGEEIYTPEELLELLGVGLEFPDYYGKNKDALFDLLTDLSWLPQDEIRVIITHAESYFARFPEWQSELKHIFSEANDQQMENKQVCLYYADLHAM